MTAIDEQIKIIIELTAALEAAVSLYDIQKAVEISAQREKILADLVQQAMTAEERDKTAGLAKKWLSDNKTMMEKITYQKKIIETELKKQVKSNQAVSLYHGNHR